MSFVRELIKSGRSSAETMWICVLSLMDEADAAARTASFARSQPVIIRRWKNIHFWSQRRFWRTASVMRRRKVHRYSIVTAGRALTGAEMEKRFGHTAL